MSRETMHWLNTQTLIGFTEKRGYAWHYREGSDNHFPGAVPVEEVERRLFDWEAEERPLYVGGGWDLYDANPQMYAEIPGRKAIVRSDTGHVLGIFKDGYQPHQYREWLLSNVAAILDDGLSIGSAGLLRDGAVAWVSVEVPETIVTPEGVAYRPNLLAATSFDGSVATTYKRVVTNVVCDNTMAVALGEEGQAYKVRHSTHSLGKLSDARKALDIVHRVSEEFEAQVRQLCETELSDQQYRKVIDRVAPMPEDLSNKRGRTMAEEKRGNLWRLWTSDNRVSHWRGTAFGAWQAMNTYTHHETRMRNKATTHRAERNMLRAVTGDTDKADAEALRHVRGVLAAA